MTEIYDLVLNFCNATNEVYDFFEWHKKDKLSYISKIPIIKINSVQMLEIQNNIIKVDEQLLLKIKNKTITDNKIIPYSLLITDSNKVIALSFSNNGLLEKRSSLLLDEEEAVIEESREVQVEHINYRIIKKTTNNIFLTRKDRKIQSFLLDKIHELYANKEYDEIDYLYQELNNNKQLVNIEYNYLINEITNNYNNKLNKIYDIICLTVKNE